MGTYSTKEECETKEKTCAVRADGKWMSTTNTNCPVPVVCPPPPICPVPTPCPVPKESTCTMWIVIMVIMILLLLGVSIGFFMYYKKNSSLKSQ